MYLSIAQSVAQRLGCSDMTHHAFWRCEPYSPCYHCICETCMYNVDGAHWTEAYKKYGEKVQWDDFCFRCEDECIEYDGKAGKHKGALPACDKYQKSIWYIMKEREIREAEAKRRRENFSVIKGVQ